jgi:hypothetical protein
MSKAGGKVTPFRFEINKKPLARGWQRLWLLSLSYAKNW